MIHVLHGSVYLHHTASTAQTIGGTDATVWEIRCALSHSTAETSSRLRQKSPQDLQTYFSCRKRRQLFVNVLYNLGVISVGIHIWVIHLHCPRDFLRGQREKRAFKPNASRLEAMYDHCLIINLPLEIKSFSCYQELKKGIDKAEWDLPVNFANRIEIREVCGKSKWKFKMAFAMKGGGSRGGLVCH